MYCMECGNEIAPESKFCSTCGTNVVFLPTSYDTQIKSIKRPQEEIINSPIGVVVNAREENSLEPVMHSAVTPPPASIDHSSSGCDTTQIPVKPEPSTDRAGVQPTVNQVCVADHGLLESSVSCCQCGVEIPPGAEFCRSCGVSLRQVNSCASCGERIIIDKPFCPKCGAFLVVGKETEMQLPAIPLSKQNPLKMLEKMGGSEGTPFGSDDLLAVRYELSEQFEQSELYSAVESEFERVLEPLMQSGKASERFFKLWIAYWKKVDGAIREIRDDICSKLNGSELLPPAFRKLASLFERDLNVLVKELENKGGDLLMLLSLQMRLQMAWQELNLIYSRIRVLRECEIKATIFDDLSIYRREDSQDTAVNHLLMLCRLSRESALEQVEIIRRVINDPDKRLSPDDVISEALNTRYQMMVNGLDKLISSSTVGYLNDAAFWYKSVCKGWLASDQELFDQISTADDNRLFDILTDVQNDIREASQQSLKVVNLTTDRLAAVNEEIERIDRQQEDAEQQRRVIDDLVKRQQSVRQLSEGKPGSALMTDMFGADVGAVIEAWGKKK